MPVWQLRLQQTLHGQSLVNVLHFDSSNPLATAEGLANAFDSFLTSDWRTMQSISVGYSAIEVQEMVADAASAHVKIPTSTTGQLTNESAPGAISMVYAIRSGYIARYRNGRFYLSGVLEDHTFNGQLSDAAFALAQTFAGRLVTEFGDGVGNTGGYHLGVWSNRVVPGLDKYDSDRFTRMKSVRVTKQLGIQRRRMIGRGS